MLTISDTSPHTMNNDLSVFPVPLLCKKELIYTTSRVMLAIGKPGCFPPATTGLIFDMANRENAASVLAAFYVAKKRQPTT